MTAIPNTAARENAPNDCVPEKAPLLTPRIGPPDVTCSFAKMVLKPQCCHQLHATVLHVAGQMHALLTLQQGHHLKTRCTYKPKQFFAVLVTYRVLPIADITIDTHSNRCTLVGS